MAYRRRSYRRSRPRSRIRARSRVRRRGSAGRAIRIGYRM